MAPTVLTDVTSTAVVDHHPTIKTVEDQHADTEEYEVEKTKKLNDKDDIKTTLKEITREELGEDEETCSKSLAELTSWLQDQPHLRNCRTDQNFLLRFLRMQKHQVEKSGVVLEKYLHMRCSHPAWFQNLDIRDKHLAELVNSGYIFVLPERDKEGRRVIFSVARNLDPARHDNSDAMRAHILTFEALLEEEENQIRGFTYIFDCSGLTLAHLSIWTPQEVAKVFSICEKNLPMRHRDINLLMLPFPMWAVFEFCKTLLSSKIRKRFSVHSSLEKLVTKLGSADILPKEYGGKVELAKMTRRWVEELSERRNSILDLDKMVVSEDDIKKTESRKNSVWGLFSGYGASED